MRELGSQLETFSERTTPPKDVCVFLEPYPLLAIHTMIITIKCTMDSLAIVTEPGPMSRCNLIVGVLLFSPASRFDSQRALQFKAIIQLDTTPIYHMYDAILHLSTVDIAVKDFASLNVAHNHSGMCAKSLPISQIAPN
jgi:hypothetical protein